MPVGVGFVAWRIGKAFTHWHQVVPIERGEWYAGRPIFTRCGREVPTKGQVSWSSDMGATVAPNELCRVCLQRIAHSTSEVE